MKKSERRRLLGYPKGSRMKGPSMKRKPRPPWDGILARYTPATNDLEALVSTDPKDAVLGEIVILSDEDVA